MKQADLLPSTTLQPHQQRVRDTVDRDTAAHEQTRLLLLHGLGSGKSLSSLSAADARGLPYTAIAPAALRPTIKKEQQRFLGPEAPAGDVISYTELAKGKPIEKPQSLFMDEAHRLRSPHTAQTLRAVDLANKAQQVILATGTPVVNHPSDFAPLYSILTGKNITPEEFTSKYVDEQGYKPSFLGKLVGRKPRPPGVKNFKELNQNLAGKIDVHSAPTSDTRVEQERVEVPMSKDQARLYKGMYEKIPFLIRHKLKQDYPLSPDELRRLTGFLTGPRQVGLSTLPFMKGKADPLKAFNRSPKLQAAMERLKTKFTDNPDARALIFSNYIDAGLTPYQKALEREGIPSAVFSGKLSDIERKKVIEDYNTGKIRAALLGPSGTEGLSFKGTRLVQRLDPHWHDVRQRQALGRADRFDSHLHLNPEDRHIQVEDYIARLPRLLGKSQPAVDDWLAARAAKRDELNQQFIQSLKQIAGHPG